MERRHEVEAGRQHSALLMSEEVYFMPPTAEIMYGEFWDVPRLFVTTYRGKQFLFYCPFEEEIDDWSEDYRVYLLSNIPDAVVKASWGAATANAIGNLGRVPVKSVKFDHTKRREIDTAVLDELIERVERKEGES